MQAPDKAFLVNAKASAFIQRSIDAQHYVGHIDVEEIPNLYEKSFERFITQNGDKVDFEKFITQAENLVTLVMTAHPTFFKSKEEANLLSKLFTARAMHDLEKVKELEAQVKNVQAQHPYTDPTTDEEGERIYDALKNTISAGHLMQRAMMNIAKKHYPDEYKNGRYSPFSRTIWQKFDRDGRIIPVNIQLSESLRQRRMGIELVQLPRFQLLLQQNISVSQKDAINEVIKKIQLTTSIYAEKEKALDAIDEENIEMGALQDIIDDLNASKQDRVTHPNELTTALTPLLQNPNTSDAIFESAKLIYDDLQANGLCFATPTHRINAKDVHHYLNVERRKSGKGDLRNPDKIEADIAHFDSTEQMITEADGEVLGSFTNTILSVPADGRPVHEMMMVRRFIYDAIDEHTIEKIDIAEAHNAMTQRGLRLATKRYGVSLFTDVGLLHEDHIGIDNSGTIYALLLKSKQYLDEISHTIPDTNKKRPRLVLKIGYSDFAKQHSSPGGKPFNEKCLLEIMKVFKDNDLADKINLDIEFAGGEGAGRRVNPKGYEWTLKETVTPSVLAYAGTHGIALKYRETIQGGDGCILLGTVESASKIMATQLDHLSHYATAPAEAIRYRSYYTTLQGKVQEHTQSARDAYSKLYNDADFALLMRLHKEMCVKGGSRKMSRLEGTSPYDRVQEDKELLADFRAIGFNAASISTGVHLPPIFGQGTALRESLKRTEDLVQSELFRERLMTSFMVRDLHVMDELKGFIELYNPEYWRKFEEFDAEGNETTEAKIAHRLDELVYSDNNPRRIYPRLKRALRIIEKDLNEFDYVRENFDFSDIEKIIAEGDYTERLAKKRNLISAIHQNRLALLHGEFVKREEMPIHSPNYTRSARSNAIKAGAALNVGAVSKVFDHASDDNRSFKHTHGLIKSHQIPLLDLNYNA